MTSEMMISKAKINFLPVVIFKGCELGVFPQNKAHLLLSKDFKTSNLE